MSQPPRPERIADMRARMAEIGRATDSFHDALRESNDERHHAFFAPVLDRVGLIVSNERAGITAYLADDLSVARSAIRRLGLPDIDPDLDEPTPALKRLRSERGNLVEALDNALDAANALGMSPGRSEFGELRVQRSAFADQLIRLDERLRMVQEAVTELRTAAVGGDADAPGAGVSQLGLVNPHVQSLSVQLSAARFETRIDNQPGIPEQTDVAALVRSIDAIRDIAADLKETVQGLTPWVATAVRLTGDAVARAAERSWRGMRTVVSVVRRRLADPPSHPTQDAPPPPPDFNVYRVYGLIQAGKAPPARWRPWIKEFRFIFKPLKDLTPLSDLTGLQTLLLDGTKVSDLTPLAGLTKLQWLTLVRAKATDLAPLSGLISLQSLVLDGTRVSDLAPLSTLTSLHTLDLNRTLASDLTPLSGLIRLQTLCLEGTPVSDLAPLSGLTGLQTLYLGGTPVSNLAPLSGVQALTEIYVESESRRQQLAPTLGERASIVKVSRNKSQ